MAPGGKRFTAGALHLLNTQMNAHIPFSTRRPAFRKEKEQKPNVLLTFLPLEACCVTDDHICRLHKAFA